MSSFKSCCCKALCKLVHGFIVLLWAFPVWVLSKLYHSVTASSTTGTDTSRKRNIMIAISILIMVLSVVVYNGIQHQANENSSIRTVQVAFHYRTIDRKDRRALSEHLLLDKFSYFSVDFGISELSLVKELVQGRFWVEIASLLGLDPNTVLNDYRNGLLTLEQYSSRFFDKIYTTGYLGRFGWNAYIEGFRAAEGLERIVKDLEDMLECNSISKTELEAVTRSRFHQMTCKKDETVTKLSLVKEMAPHWKKLAKTFQLDSIDPEEDIPERAAYVVLQRLYDNGYKGELGWQGVLNVLRDAGAGRIHAMLDQALDCVITCWKVDRYSTHAITLSRLHYLEYEDENKEKHELRVIEEIASSWRDLCLILGCTVAEIEGKGLPPGKEYTVDCCQEVLKRWMDKGGTEHYPLSWDSLVKALRAMGLGRVARNIETALECAY